MEFLKRNLSFFISLLLTIIVGIYFYYQAKNDFFPDATIQKRGETYTEAFNQTAMNSEQGLLNMKEGIDSLSFFNLSNDQKTQFLLSELNKYTNIQGIFILDHAGSFSTLYRDQKMYIFASDSANSIDNVLWYRIDEKNEVKNSWNMDLGYKINLLEKDNKRFSKNIELNKLYWSSSLQLFSASNYNIVNHISWKNNNSVFTCIAIINEEGFIGRNQVLENADYQSFLINSDDQKLIIHKPNMADTVSVYNPSDYGSIKSWEITGMNMPGTFSFRNNGEMWWGRAVPVNIEGLKGMVVSTSETSLYYSAFLDHLFELALIIIFVFITLFFLIRNFRKSHQSLEEYTEEQSNDLHASELIKLGETATLEFKSSFHYDYQLQKVNKDLESVIAKSVAAFSNASGGTLLIGVDDEGIVLGLKNDINTLKRKDLDFFENTLRMFLNKAFSVGFVTQNVKMKFPVINGVTICRIDIIASNEPVFVEVVKKSNKAERFYVRSGNTSQEIIALSEINSYVNNRFSSNI